MDTLYNLIQWMAETVVNGEWKNAFLERLLEYEETYDLLKEIGRALESMFG